MYGTTSLVSHFPRSHTPSVTAGLKCPPEICPPAKIITMSAEPIASGASGPAPWPMTVHPIVRTRKKVPMNSAMYFCMTYLLQVSPSVVHTGMHTALGNNLAIEERHLVNKPD